MAGDWGPDTTSDSAPLRWLWERQEQGCQSHTTITFPVTLDGLVAFSGGWSRPVDNLECCPILRLHDHISGDLK